MNKLTLLFALLFSISTPLALSAHDHGTSDKSATPDAAWLAKAKAEYPLKLCVISDDELGGSMGEAVDYVYKQPGKPDRLVRFCCKNCIKDFNEDPGKYLKQIDEAPAKTKKN